MSLETPRHVTIGAAMRTLIMITIAACLALTVRTALAETYLVNPEGTGDFPTMQAAIDAAVDGDVVVLADRTYRFFPNVALQFYGEEITLESQSGNPASCVLEAQHSGYNGNAMAFYDGESEKCVIRGITMRKFGGEGNGGAVLIANASAPTFEHVNLMENTADNSGAFVIYEGGARFRDCIFAGNSAEISSGGGSVGGTSHCDFERCLFTGNRADVAFGALYVGSGTVVSMTDCTIAGNSAGGGIPATGGVWAHAGGVLNLVRTVIWDNCHGEAGVSGAGILTFDCCVVDSAEVVNEQGAGTVSYLGENVFEDPIFCEPSPCDAAPTSEGEYTVAAGSPALLAACGPIGALGEGCPTVSLEALSWGRLKGIYRFDE
jgi:hypothetical protein